MPVEATAATQEDPDKKASAGTAGTEGEGAYKNANSKATNTKDLDTKHAEEVVWPELPCDMDSGSCLAEGFVQGFAQGFLEGWRAGK